MLASRTVLLSLALAGIAFGKEQPKIACVDTKHEANSVVVHYADGTWTRYTGYAPEQISPDVYKAVECVFPTSAVITIDPPVRKKPAGQNKAKPQSQIVATKGWTIVPTMAEICAEHICVEPISVPAIHHDFIQVKSYAECPGDYLLATQGDGQRLCQPPREWACADESRALLVAQNQKHAWCLREP